MLGTMDDYLTHQRVFHDSPAASHYNRYGHREVALPTQVAGSTAATDAEVDSTNSTASSSAPSVGSPVTVPTRRPVLYLSGPMHGSKVRPDDRDMMFEVAKLYSRQLWQYGYAVFTPHGNTTHMHGVPGLYSEPFLQFDLEYLCRRYEGMSVTDYLKGRG